MQLNARFIVQRAVYEGTLAALNRIAEQPVPAEEIVPTVAASVLAQLNDVLIYGDEVQAKSQEANLAVENSQTASLG